MFRSVYEFTTEQARLVFFAIKVGSVLAVPTIIARDYFLYQPRVRKGKKDRGSGAVAPKYRLYSAMIGGFWLPVGLFVSLAISRCPLFCCPPIRNKDTLCQRILLTQHPVVCVDSPI